MYYVLDYYTHEIIDTFKNFDDALNLAKKTLDSKIVDENNNFFYCNVDLPF